jgi:phage FluMu protein Com
MKGQTPKVQLECNFCHTKFYRAIRSATVEIHCPKCKETDVEVADLFPIHGK